MIVFAEGQRVSNFAVKLHFPNGWTGSVAYMNGGYSVAYYATKDENVANSPLHEVAEPIFDDRDIFKALVTISKMDSAPTK